MKEPEIIILANGNFPKLDKLLNIIDNAKQIICCDGAVNKLVDSGREPSIIIGDLDSVRPEIKAKYKNKLIHITEQYTNDLTKAVNWCLNNNIKEVTIMGATGEREDHTIANIALLTEYQKQIKVQMLTDNGKFIPINKTSEFDSFAGQQVSIFSLDNNIEFSSEGLKYPLNNLEINGWWQGSLNQSEGNKFTVSCKGSCNVIVYLNCN